MQSSPDQTELVRSFNRFYTRRIGLLREGLLDTAFSLTQARLLYELASHSGIRSTDLISELDLDPGYLSRLLKNFEKQGLVKRAVSAKDRRVNHLALTAAGRKVFYQAGRPIPSRNQRAACIVRPFKAATADQQYVFYP